MAFRKRNIGIPGSRSVRSSEEAQNPPAERKVPPSQATEKRSSVLGVRPSPVDGSPIISTGTPSLDSLLAGHAGLVLGNSLLIEESGATDYAGTLLRYYAAEGVLQDHRVHVVGVSEQWARELPGLASGAKERVERAEKFSIGDRDRMKIAWRYERFADSGAGQSRGQAPRPAASEAKATTSPRVFCHAFDLTKRLELPHPAGLNVVPIRSSSPSSSPFSEAIKSLKEQLSALPDTTIHRVVIPSILSPAPYPPWSCLPQHILQFYHALRVLLRQYPLRLSAVISLSITLHPRETGLTRWMELLSDGVIELTPFPHTVDMAPSLATSGAATEQEEKPQGMAKIHRLPVFHERGGGSTGSAGVGDDLSFTVTRRRFVIKPFSLPPIEGDTDAQNEEVEGNTTKVSLDF